MFHFPVQPCHVSSCWLSRPLLSWSVPFHQPFSPFTTVLFHLMKSFPLQSRSVPSRSDPLNSFGPVGHHVTSARPIQSCPIPSRPTAPSPSRFPYLSDPVTTSHLSRGRGGVGRRGRGRVIAAWPAHYLGHNCSPGGTIALRHLPHHGLSAPGLRIK